MTIFDQRVLWEIQVKSRKKQIKMWKREIKDLKRLLEES